MTNHPDDSVNANLAIEAALAVESSAGRIEMYGAGTTIEARPDRLRTWVEILRGGSGATRSRRAASVAHTALERVGLTLEVRCGRWKIARLGRGAKMTLASRLGRLPGVEVGWVGLLLAAFALMTAPGRRKS